jgi:ABC-type transport system involved in multi-copper enzyme maturation permease subunit
MTAAVPLATRHKAFSFTRVAAISSNTLLELIRLKVFYFLLFFGLIVIGISFFTSQLSFVEQHQALKSASLGAMSIFTWLLAVLATAMLLPKDIEDRTLYTILAKPVPRFEYLLGKFVGVLMLLFIALSLMSALFVVVLYFGEQSAIAEVLRHTPQKDVPAALEQVHQSTFNSNLLPGIIVIYFKSALCAALTLLISTFASSSIFTVIVSVIATLIGHIQPIAREAYLSSHAAGAIAKTFFALVAIAMPDMRALDLADDVIAGNAIPMMLFLKTISLGGTYICVYFLVGYFMFSGKEL